MSLILAAAFILARARSGELEFGRGRIYTGLGQGIALPSVQKLKKLRHELSHWGMEPWLEPALALIIQAGLLEKTGEKPSKLLPAEKAYSWLQLPLYQALAYLYEKSEFRLEEDMLTTLRRGVVKEPVTDPALEATLKMLDSFELLETWGKVVYAAQGKKTSLLELLARKAAAPAQAELLLLEVSKAWQEAFPFALPGKGWLEYHPNEYSFSFVASPLEEHGPEPACDPWQLFRLLSICEPGLSSSKKRLVCFPKRERVVKQALEGTRFNMILVYLEEGLNRQLPRDFKVKLRGWYRSAGLYRIRPVVLLECEDRAAMQKLIGDYRLRSYFKEVFSPRRAELQRAEIDRFRRLLARRNIYPQVSPELEPHLIYPGKLLVTLTRSQLQSIVGALKFQRRKVVEEGTDAVSFDSLITIFENCLTRRERIEAEQLAEEYLIPHFPENNSIPPARTEAGEKELLERLEEAVESEKELAIEYFTPGKPARVRLIEPLALYEEHGQIYVIAYCNWRKEQRIFRLDRMRLVNLQNGS